MPDHLRDPLRTRHPSSEARPASYLRDPAAIYAQSFATIRREADLSALPEDLHDVAVRLIHACGMPDIVGDLTWSHDVVSSGRHALRGGAVVLTDTKMVAEGVLKPRLPADNRVICAIGDPETSALAKRNETTRSAAAVDLWLPVLEGAVIAIGNAPTALFRLLELLGQGAPHPAAILAFPVGFVGAVESKEALVAAGLGVPYLTLRGRRGGSAFAAAAVNALTSATSEGDPSGMGGVSAQAEGRDSGEEMKT